MPEPRDDTLRPSALAYIALNPKDAGPDGPVGFSQPCDRAGLTQLLSYYRSANSPVRPLFVVWRDIRTPMPAQSLRAEVVTEDQRPESFLMFTMTPPGDR